MNLQAILDQFTDPDKTGRISEAFHGKTRQVNDLIPGGLAGGAMAGGVMALLLGNKSTRKFAGKTLTIGGAALLGGLAYKAYKSWQHGNYDKSTICESSFTSAEILSPEYQLTLIKAMIAAARADGHIDSVEQQRIFEALEDMELTTELKAMMFDLLRQPITIDELAIAVTTLEQKSELYLVSCLFLDPNQQAEQAYLKKLAQAMELPDSLSEQLQRQARQIMANA
jgi:uncharacterized membrane protein YebE (DUF533 family)